MSNNASGCGCLLIIVPLLLGLAMYSGPCCIAFCAAMLFVLVGVASFSDKR